MDESGFLGRVGECLGRPRTSVSSLEVAVPLDAERPSTPDGLAERFTRELEQVGGVVHRVSSRRGAGDAISEILKEHEARRVVLGATSRLGELGLESALSDAGVDVTICDLRREAPRDRLRDAEFAAEVGITSADYGIAETGTLALLAAPGQGRAVSLLPLIHIAVLRASDIVYELSGLFERIGGEANDLPSALTFITGPSRTADIELVLTVGVHGPKYLHLVLRDDE